MKYLTSHPLVGAPYDDDLCWDLNVGLPTSSLCFPSSQGLNGVSDFCFGGGVAVYFQQVWGYWDICCQLRRLPVEQLSTLKCSVHLFIPSSSLVVRKAKVPFPQFHLRHGQERVFSCCGSTRESENMTAESLRFIISENMRQFGPRRNE